MSTASRGDWICSDAKCGNLNFSKREKCHKCGKRKTHGHSHGVGREIGKEGAEKSKGLFSQDDWICKNCGNVNWARRTVCNACNTPVTNTLGERTGYGGGFMERDEVIEYKRHTDSDDEYDEFGRKKKRFRGPADAKENHFSRQSTTVSNKANEHQHNRIEENETNKNEGIPEDQEDEEDSGDDEDLSKYDIWGEDDENGVEPGINQSKRDEVNNSRKSSESSSSDSESDSSASSSTSSRDRDSQSSVSSNSSTSPTHEDSVRSDVSDSKKKKNSEGRQRRNRSRFEKERLRIVA